MVLAVCCLKERAIRPSMKLSQSSLSCAEAMISCLVEIHGMKSCSDLVPLASMYSEIILLKMVSWVVSATHVELS